ncbi:LysM peptidoglycan-binding domain-containing protein [Paenibacillus sp. MBLB4367]|uniref:LysM peptidoglycan-binding domain-containing protein n=1 Tax=Paenibacillus sp. MBLB4367 TaxID=3384767 RepID=UPI0039082DD4
MAGQQAGLRFDIYERVHLSDELAGIKELDEIELLPQIQVRTEGDQAVLKGNLWLTGKYVGDEDDQLLSLEHFIPVEITLPMNRVHRMEDVAVEIENFDFDLLSSRSMNVTGVLSLAGIELTTADTNGWREEEEVVFVHETGFGDISARGEVQERQAEPGTAWEARSSELQEPVEEAVWEARSSELQEPVEEAAWEARSSELQEPVEEAAWEARSSELQEPVQEAEWEARSGELQEPVQEAAREARSIQWQEPVEEAAQEARRSEWQEPVQETVWQPPSDIVPQRQQEAAWQNESGAPISGRLDESTYADERARLSEPSVSQPQPETEEDKKELKIAFTGKPAGEFEHLHHLKSIALKSESRGPSSGNADAASAVATDHSRDSIEWKKLLSANNNEQQFKRVRICIVQKEETVESIADRYQINPREIVLYNRLGSQPLAEGQVIYIP